MLHIEKGAPSPGLGERGRGGERRGGAENRKGKSPFPDKHVERLKTGRSLLFCSVYLLIGTQFLAGSASWMHLFRVCRIFVLRFCKL